MQGPQTSYIENPHPNHSHMASKTKKKPAPKYLTTAGVLRKIKPLLPKSFRKLDLNVEFYSDGYNIWPGYTDGRVIVEVRSVCNFNLSLGEKGKCHATNVVVRTDKKYRAKNRSYHPRSDGTFNFEGIGTAINASILQSDQDDKNRAAALKENTDRKKEEETNRKKVLEFLRERGLSTDILTNYSGTDVEQIDMHLDVSVHRGLEIRLSNLTPNQLQLVLDAVTA